MYFKKTNGKDKDFIKLCKELDCSLNALVGGVEKRADYIQYNHLDTINDVIVVYDDSTPIGCGSFKNYSSKCAEIKRVYMQKAYRGKGIAKQLMLLLECSAKEQGYTSLILETGFQMTAAIALYKHLGFNIIPNFGPYKNMSESVCMEKTMNRLGFLRREND